MQTGVLGTRMCCFESIHTNPSPNPDYGWNLAKSSRQKPGKVLRESGVTIASTQPTFPSHPFISLPSLFTSESSCSLDSSCLVAYFTLGASDYFPGRALKTGIQSGAGIFKATF